MAHKITKIAELKKYMTEMIRTGRSDDAYPRIQHAKAVSPELVALIAGFMAMYADDNSIEIATRINGAGIVHEVNHLWFTVQGRVWVIVYSAANKRIELRQRSKQGAAMHALDKTTGSAKVGAIFAAL
jgi:hypothetical protein